MKTILNCRRSIISALAIICLTFLGIYHGVDISEIAFAIAGVAGSLSGANAWEAKGKPKPGAATKPDSPD